MLDPDVGFMYNTVKYLNEMQDILQVFSYDQPPYLIFDVRKYDL